MPRGASTGLVAAAVSLLGACGLASSGEGSVAGQRAADGAAPEWDSAVCGSGCAADDGSLATLGAPDDAFPGSDHRAPTVREAGGDGSAVLDAGADASVDSGVTPLDGTAGGCNDTCVNQMCGGPCAPGSTCELYLACLILCGSGNSSSCSSQCNSTYPTGPLVAACAIACGAQCAASSGSDAASGND
jgi:hypothetical protein